MPIQPRAATPGENQAKPVRVHPAPSSRPEAAAKHGAENSGAPAAQKRSKNFSDDPLALARRPADGQPKAKVVYGAEGQRRDQPLPQDDEDRFSMSVSRREAPESRLTPARTTFSGGEDTLPYMDSNPPPEINMRYRLMDNASTRLTFNPQDPASPLYRPVESEGRINAAGLYMDMDLRPDVRLQVGGEYYDIETRDIQTGTSQGAAVSLRWNF
jgi:hypothetical protein